MELLAVDVAKTAKLLDVAAASVGFVAKVANIANTGETCTEGICLIRHGYWKYAGIPVLLISNCGHF